MMLSDVRAIITGAGSGIGRHFSLRLAEAGARVVAGDVNEDGLEALRISTKGAPGVVFTEILDVSKERSIETFVGAATQSLDGINILVNNAGVLKDGLLVSKDGARVRKLPLEQWKQVTDTNLTGAYLMAREVAADMIRREERHGVIINISSLSRSGNAGQTSYAASKAGLDACTRTWALELAPRIRVAAIAPGLIDTPMLSDISEQRKSSILKHLPLDRYGTVDETWLALKFIIECDYFTGRVLEVDGGLVF